MPITPVHFGINITIYYIISLVTPIEFLLANCFLLLLAELIDIDHLFSKPIYKKDRNSFKTHIFHKNWKYVVIIAIPYLFFYPFLFFGLGLLSHLLVDYIHGRYYLKI